MRQQFSLVNSWLDNAKRLKEKHQTEIDELKRANSEVFFVAHPSMKLENSNRK